MMADNTQIITNGTTPTKQQRWESHIKQSQLSGLSNIEYCRRNMLDYDKFKYWQKKLASNQMSQLVPVQLSTLPNNISNDLDVGQVAPLITLCTLTFKNGAELKVHSAEAIPMLLSYMGR